MCRRRIYPKIVYIMTLLWHILSLMRSSGEDCDLWTLWSLHIGFMFVIWSGHYLCSLQTSGLLLAMVELLFGGFSSEANVDMSVHIARLRSCSGTRWRSAGSTAQTWISECRRRAGWPQRSRYPSWLFPPRSSGRLCPSLAEGHLSLPVKDNRVDHEKYFNR